MNLIRTLLLLALGSARAFAAAPRLPANALPVPLVPQATSYSCGAASLMAVMEYWTVFEAPETTLYGPLGTTPKDGTEEHAIAKVAQQYGLRAEVRENLGLQDLRDALKDGTTVIVDLQAWTDKTGTIDWKNDWEDGHYVVLVAMDAEYAYFSDPSAHGAYAYLPQPELLERWHDYDGSDAHPRHFQGLAVFIHGNQPHTHYPADLIRMR